MTSCKGDLSACLSPKRKLRSLDSRYLIHTLSQNGIFSQEPLVPSPIKRSSRRAAFLQAKIYTGKLLDDDDCLVNGVPQDTISCDGVGDVPLVTCDLSTSNGRLTERPSSLELIASTKVVGNSVTDPLSTAANNHPVANGISWLTSSVGNHKPLSTVQSTPSMNPASPGSTGGTLTSAHCSSSPASPFVAHSSSGDGSSSAVSSPSVSCNWEGCAWSQTLASPEDLHDHVLTRHVTPQSLSKRRKYFMCLWSECRLFKVSSLSFTWLERHVLEHSGAQPYVCIFYPTCRQRLATQVLLERHVQRVHMSCNLNNGQHNDVSNSSSSLIASSTLLSSSHDIQASSSGYSTTATSRQNSNSSTCGRKLSTALKKKRRRRKIRPYRVHSIDFLDARSSNCLQDFNQMFAFEPGHACQSTFMGLRTFPHVIISRRTLKGKRKGEKKKELLVRFLSDRIHDGCNMERWISEEDYRIVSDTCS